MADGLERNRHSDGRGLGSGSRVRRGSNLGAHGYGGSLVLGRNITSGGGSWLAQWSGTNWRPFPHATSNINCTVSELVVAGDYLFAFGSLRFGASSAYDIARYDPSTSTWTAWAFPTTLPVTSFRYSAVAWGGGVAALSTNGPYFFDGVSWSMMNYSLDANQPPICMGVFQGNLYLAEGTSNPAVYETRIKIWTGSSWSTVYSQNPAVVNIYCMYEWDNQFIISGRFTTNGIDYSGANITSHIASWDGGSSWSPLGAGVSGTNSCVVDLKTHNGQLLVRGNFTSAGGNTTANVASWNGSAWSVYPSGAGAVLTTGGPTPFARRSILVPYNGGFWVDASSASYWRGTDYQLLTTQPIATFGSCAISYPYQQVYT